VAELTKAKRELLEVVEQKNLELDEKNASIKNYLNKVVRHRTLILVEIFLMEFCCSHMLFALLIEHSFHENI
jgi:hypothetical protein